jgi:hypothetical protein
MALDVVITSALQQSTLGHSAEAADYIVKGKENRKFSDDRRSVNPLSMSADKRLIPLAMNHIGWRGPHFNAFLKEMATALITRPSGCYLISGSFAMSQGAALAHIMARWGARITWSIQREFAAPLVRAVMAHKASAAFLQALPLTMVVPS